MPTLALPSVGQTMNANHPHLGSISCKASKFTQCFNIVWEVLRSAMHILDMYYNIHCQIDIELLLLTLNRKEQMSLLEYHLVS